MALGVSHMRFRTISHRFGKAITAEPEFRPGSFFNGRMGRKGHQNIKKKMVDCWGQLEVKISGFWRVSKMVPNGPGAFPN